MEYKVMIDKFEGPLDLLLHLIKESNVNICDISIEEITEQYLDYIKKMQDLNLNIAGEYIVMAAELIEMKSNMLLPKPKLEDDPREQLINRLLDYEHYKEMTGTFKDLEIKRKEFYTKEPSDLRYYGIEFEPKLSSDVSVNDLLSAFNSFLENQERNKPLNTKITTKEYSVSERCKEIISIIGKKKKVQFDELFDVFTKEYVVVTFLSILDLARKQEIEIKQDNNFNKIYISKKEI